MRDQAAGANTISASPQQAPQLAMSELVHLHDWAATPLGPASSWPDSLQAVVRILLTSGFPMWMAWGPELTILYNDAYARTTLGKKHPWALGRSAPEVWREIWREIGPLVDRVVGTGDTCYEEELQLILERNGYPEESFHTFSYSPLDGPDGRIAGMLCVVIEDTVRVIGERQLSALSTLSGALAGAITEQDVFAAIARGVAGQPDMPFTLAYLFEDDEKTLRLVSKTGFAPDSPLEQAAAPLTFKVDDPSCPWPVQLLMDANRAVTVDDLSERFTDLPRGSWDRPSGQAHPSHYPPGTGKADWRFNHRLESLPAARRRLRQLPRPGRRTDLSRDYQCPGL